MADGWLCTGEWCDCNDWDDETWICCFLTWFWGWICGCLIFPLCTK